MRLFVDHGADINRGNSAGKGILDVFFLRSNFENIREDTDCLEMLRFMLDNGFVFTARHVIALNNNFF